MARKKQVSIKLENEQGEVKEYKAGKIMARTTRDIMKMYSQFEQVDEKGNPVLDEVEQIDLMIDLVADSIFRRVDEITPDAILDGVESDKLADVLQDCIMTAMGMDEEDVKAAEEGK